MAKVFSSLSIKGNRSSNLQLPFHINLKDKSGVGIIVDCSRDYTVVNGV